MNTRILQDPQTGDPMLLARHPSGLEIRVAEQRDFTEACAQFGIRYGSVHTRYRLNGKVMPPLPAGIAHFLEHQLFESEDCNISEKFSALGASENAYTGFDRTVYLFQTCEHFPEALALLLQFVQQPCFTEATVRKERGIILQELKEYALDSPSERVFHNLLKGLYGEHPVSTDICGTRESLLEITPELLYRCHALFYHPARMVLCCAGNVDIEQVLEIAERTVVLPETPCAALLPPEKSETVFSRFVRAEMPVGKTLFSIGFRSSPVTGTELLRQSECALAALELLIGESTPLYQRLLTEGLINDTFSTGCFCGENWFVCLAEGESDAPDAVLEALLNEIRQAESHGFDEARFAVLKRAAYGEAICGMNSPQGAVSEMIDSFFRREISPFSRTEYLAQMTLNEVQKTLCDRFSADQVCLSVLEAE